MKKEIILGLFASSLLLTSCDSSTEDPLISEDASSLSSKARKEMMWSEALTRASSVSDVQTWTGEKKIVELKNVKYALGPDIDSTFHKAFISATSTPLWQRLQRIQILFIAMQ